MSVTAVAGRGPESLPAAMPSHYRIGDLTLDAGRRRVLRGDEVVPLGPLSYRLLQCLAGKAPDVASHDDIADGVWNGRPVSPETIKQRVKLVRDALGDDAKRPRYIDVARGSGYRLIPPVEALESSAVAVMRRDGPWRRVPAIAVLLLAAGAAALVVRQWADPGAGRSPTASRLPGAGPVPAVTDQRVNSRAFDLYLHGRHQVRLYTQDSFAEAERYFEEAIRADAEFIPAYYSLGFVYVLQALDIQVPLEQTREKLRSIVNRGLALAPDEPGLIALSGQLARYDGDNELAARRFGRAADADPSNMMVLMLDSIFTHDRGYPERSLEILARALETDPLNPLLIIGVVYCNIDLGNAAGAMAAAAHLREVPGASPLPVIAVTKELLLGDFAGSVRDSRAFMRGLVPATEIAETGGVYGFPNLYFDLGDTRSGDAAMRLFRRFQDKAALRTIEVQQMLYHGNVARARARAIDLLQEGGRHAGGWNDDVVLRLATDALIERGEARRAVDLIERLAPVYRSYKVRRDIDARRFSPAPYPVKSNFSTFPAVYFPDYINALRASGDDTGAANMLRHLDAVVALRRQRGLFLEERYAAELHALRGEQDAALDALERAEKDRTIYRNWKVFLMHNSILSEIRERARFRALIERIENEMARQLASIPRQPASRDPAGGG